MRWLAWIAAALVGLIALAAVVALLLFDAEQLRAPVIELAESQLGRELELGEMDLAILPLPAVRATQIRIAGPTPADPPFAEVAELRLRVAVLPLLVGRVVLRALELESPRVRIPLDSEGRPILPGPSEAASESAAKSADVAEPAEGAADTESAAPALAVQRIVVSDGSVELGPWRAESVDLAGALRLDGTADVTLSAEFPGLGRLTDARASFSGLIGNAPAAEVRTDLVVDLEGDAELVAARGESFSLDLSAAELAVADQLRKPAGEKLVISGPLGAELQPAALSAVQLSLGANRLDLLLDLSSATPSVRIEPSSLDLAALSPFLSPDLPRLGGTLRIAGLSASLEPLALSGGGALDQVTLELEHGTVSISGDLVARGSLLRLEDGRLVVGGQPAAVSGSYDLERGTAELFADLARNDLEALLGALRGRAEVTGLLAAGLSLRGPPELSKLLGSGSFAITDGAIRGFSLLRQILGQLVSVGELVAKLEGVDLSRYEEEEFKLLSADFRLANGHLRTENLTLRGGIGLEDGALDLSGRIELSKDVDEDLGKSADSRRRTVIPIAAIGGTVSRPRVRLDRRALAQVAVELTTSGRLRNKLEEKLGVEGADAVQDLLEGILGGRKK